MGWLFYATSRGDLIRDLIKPSEGASIVYDGILKQETLKWCCKGNNLWAVKQVTKPDGEQMRFVVLYMMRNSRYGWGYKDMDESCGFYQVNCPLSYLDGLTEPVSEWSREWREKVRAYHAERSNQRKRAADLQPGAAVTLYGKPYTVVRLLRGSYLEVRDTTNGVVYLARRSQVD